MYDLKLNIVLCLVLKRFIDLESTFFKYIKIIYIKTVFVHQICILSLFSAQLEFN